MHQFSFPQQNLNLNSPWFTRGQSTIYFDKNEWVSDCCLMPTQQFVSYTIHVNLIKITCSPFMIQHGRSEETPLQVTCEWPHVMTFTVYNLIKITSLSYSPLLIYCVMADLKKQQYRSNASDPMSWIFNDMLNTAYDLFSINLEIVSMYVDTIFSLLRQTSSYF
jgi:hypothetical protein